MKSFIALVLCIAVAVALPLDDSKNAVILQSSLDNIGVEGYRYGYETSDGKSASEQGQLKNIGTPEEALDVTGEFTFVAPDGVTYKVQYIANEFGFQPQGAHLPKAA